MAGTLATLKSFATTITPTAGTNALRAQSHALKRSAMSLPKSSGISKSAGVADYSVRALKGLGSLGADATKSFGKAFSGQDARGIVANHKNIPLHPDKVNVFKRFAKRHKIDKLYEMDDTAMRKAV